jgi:hypothetical protein
LKCKEAETIDTIYLGVVVIFFAITWGLLKLCEGLLGDEA